VTFALDTLWLGAPVRPPMLRGLHVTADFEKKLNLFDKATRQRLRYYARFLQPDADGVRLWVRCGSGQACFAHVGTCVLLLCSPHCWCRDALLSNACAAGSQGVCGPTAQDPNRAFYDDLLRASVPPPPPASTRGGTRTEAAAAALGDGTAEALARAGLQVWAGGMGHAEWLVARAALVAPPAADGGDDEFE
jgi:hypothetical protein